MKKRRVREPSREYQYTAKLRRVNNRAEQMFNRQIRNLISVEKYFAVNVHSLIPEPSVTYILRSEKFD